MHVLSKKTLLKGLKNILSISTLLSCCSISPRVLMHAIRKKVQDSHIFLTSINIFPSSEVELLWHILECTVLSFSVMFA